MNLPELTKGNCHIYSLLFTISNFKHSTWKIKLIKNRGKWLISSHCIYKDELRITYRSHPKGNGARNWFKGRPQVISLSKYNNINKIRNENRGRS